MLPKRVFTIAVPALLAAALTACGGTGSAPSGSGLLPAQQPNHVAQSVSADGYKSAVLSDLPTAYYRLDDSSSTASDISGSGLNGQVGSSVKESAAGLVGGSTDSAMTFPAVKSSAGVVMVPRNHQLEPSTAVSLEVLLSFPATPQTYTVPVSYGTDSSYAPYDLYFVNGKIAAQFRLNSGVLTVTSPSALQANTTYHVVSTFDGATGRLYVNGALVASASKSGSLRGYTKGYGLAIGDDAGFSDPAFHGTLDEVAVYANKALSAARVSAHYQASKNTVSAATPAPTASPAPVTSAAPIASATPVPTTAPTAAPAPVSGNQATYAGCGIYPADDVYNKNIASATVDPNSSTIIGGLPTVAWWMPLPANERANLATNATPVQTVTDSYGKSFSVPWTSSYYIEPGDSHAIVLNTNTCQAVLSYGTSQSSGVVKFTAARTADYTKPFVPTSADGGGDMASGLDMFAGAIKDSDIASGAIRHALNLGFPTGHGVSQNGYVFPAGLPTRLSCTSNCTHPLHYGDHLRLKAGYTCPSAASYPQANMICVALKTYGAFYADQASYMELYFLQSSNGSSPYNASDISHFNPPISDFEVLTESVKCWNSTSCT